MKPIIYIDVLFVVNLFVNYLLLFTTGKLIRLKTKWLRLFLGAALGAVYAVCMFFPNLNFMYSIGAKLLFSLFLIAITFNISGPRLYFRTLLVFYFLTFSFGGGVMALFYFTDAGQRLGAVISNGILYFNLPTGILLFFVAICTLLSFSVWRIYRVKLTNIYLPIKIIHNNTEIAATALIDTGNALYDPLSNIPVVVLEYGKIKNILPESVRKAFEEKGGNEINVLTEVAESETEAFKFRLIPYTSLGRQNGMLLGFLPDLFYVVENETETAIGDIIIGIYNNKLTSNGQYNALMHPEILGR